MGFYCNRGQEIQKVKIGDNDILLRIKLHKYFLPFSEKCEIKQSRSISFKSGGEYTLFFVLFCFVLFFTAAVNPCGGVLGSKNVLIAQRV